MDFSWGSWALWPKPEFVAFFLLKPSLIQYPFFFWLLVLRLGDNDTIPLMALILILARALSLKLVDFLYPSREGTLRICLGTAPVQVHCRVQIRMATGVKLILRKARASFIQWSLLQGVWYSKWWQTWSEQKSNLSLDNTFQLVVLKL